jgi:F-type H+-transporting ATPase subunit b
MPQFESQYFISQIFWFVICFVTIYFTVSKIYIPKIKEILQKREEKKSLGNLALKNIEEEIRLIEEKNSLEKQILAKKYNKILNDARNEAAQKRDKELVDLEKKIINLNSDAAHLIKNFQDKSQDYSSKVVTTIKKKILNKLS